jgi:hypothetical protein
MQQEGERVRTPGATFDVTSDYPGLWLDEQAGALAALYARNYTTTPPTGLGDPQPGSQPDVRASLMAEVNRELDQLWGPVPVGMIWGDGFHSVLVTDVKDDRVYIRNPWGSNAGVQGQSYVNGEEIAGPPQRRVEDATAGVESMTIEEFQSLVDSVVSGPPLGSASVDDGSDAPAPTPAPPSS